MPSVRRLDWLPDPESAFVHLYGDSPNAFWLDSSAEGERGRFSFIGDASGPLGAVVTYEVGGGNRGVDPSEGSADEVGLLRIERGDEVETRRESIFDFLAKAGPPLRVAAPGRASDANPELPFGFDCGLVGYLGYELKAECGGAKVHPAPTPDAALIQADRLIAFDHHARRTYLLALTTPTELHQILGPAGREFDAVRLRGEGEGWIWETEQRLGSLPTLGGPAPLGFVGDFVSRRSCERYREDVEACKRYLTAGHSYEICLANRVEAEARVDPLDLYRRLRRANPAPFSAYLRFGNLAVLSSSPERFLSVDREGWAETRPIKGTARRGRSGAEDARLAVALREDEKSRAENVTIVDLMRNDLGRVCRVGSVGAAELMRVESYETVHQLVSSVRGRLCPELGAAEAVRACFPPGSMTGAPKLRTMEIIDELEGEARGAYSGAIGWFGCSGACDLSVAIRTIVLDRGLATIGAGGAIVVDSDPEAELEEMLLKAAAPAAALDPGAAISFAPAAAPDESERRPLSPTPTS